MARPGDRLVHHSRPGHADLSGAIKYGYNDLRPALERASARETAARVAVGAICKIFLAELGIQVGGYVCAIGEVSADMNGIPLEERPDALSKAPCAAPMERPPRRWKSASSR